MVIRGLRSVLSEWPTLGMIAICYGGWAIATAVLPSFSLPLAIGVAAVMIALHGSLQHEVIHGHPFRHQLLNSALVAPSLNMIIPYLRFRDTHLAHHRDALLTDPYDDPESNYIDPLVWDRMPSLLRHVLAYNNTLIGRLLLGPLIGQVMFMRSDWSQRTMQDVVKGWLWHLPAVVLPILWLYIMSDMPLWAYALAAYTGLSILKLRSFLEHQAHDSARGRTVVIADRGPFALLFLNNNYHVVHHMHPRVAWFRLPALFAANRDKYLRRNHGYYFASYATVLRRYLFRRKDPVPHPLWRGDQRSVNRDPPAHQPGALSAQPAKTFSSATTT